MGNPGRPLGNMHNVLIKFAPQRVFFDTWSRFYDLAPVQLAVYRPVHAAVLRELRTAAGTRVLDVGCGTANLTARLPDATGADLVAGCDFSLGMLQQASSETTRVAWLQSDAAHLPVRTSSVDTVTSTESFHWFPEPDATLVEFHRVLRPGGRLMVALVNPPLQLTASAARAGSSLLGQPARWPTRAEIVHRMENTGFRLEAQRRIIRAGALLLPTVLTLAVKPARRPCSGR